MNYDGGLTNKESLAEIQKLFDMCFQANAKMDRIVYVLDLVFNLTKFQEYVHENIAHLFPSLADDIERFGRNCGDLFEREGANDTYERASDTMKEFVTIMAELSLQTDKAIEACAKNKDNYEDFLRDFRKNKIIPLLRQANVFYKAISCFDNNENLCKWNSEFDDYIVDKNGG